MKAFEGHRYYKERTKLETVIPLQTPFILYVDPSSICNLKCRFCPCGGAHKELWTEEKRNSIGIMPYDLFCKIVDDCAEFDDKIKVLRLYKEGEPLVNPGFSEMVRYAKKADRFRAIDTTTNGTLLNPELNRKIVDAGLSRINISVEALDGEGYYNICGEKLDYENFRNHIRDLYEHKGDCHIFIKTLAERFDEEHNEKLKKRFFELFGDICDEIAYEYLAPCWPAFDKELYSGRVGVYGNEIQECKVCPRLFYILTINSDGAATRCIVDWNRQMLIGDAKEQSVKELWKAMDMARIEHLKGNRRKMAGCEHCLEIETAAIDNIDIYAEELLKRFPEGSHDIADGECK